MALSASVDIVSGEWIVANSERVASNVEIFKGAALSWNEFGYLTPAASGSESDTGFAGWARESYDNTGEASTPGPLLPYGLPFVLEMTKTYSAPDNGKAAYASTDEVATATVTGGFYMGVFCGEGTKGSAFTKISPFQPRIA